MADYISREAALTILERLRDKCSNDDMSFALNWAADTIKGLTAADVVERKRGEWEYEKGNYDRLIVVCSRCGQQKPILVDSFKFNYCPNCGADMRGVITHEG